MSHDRRSVLTAIGLALPFGLDPRIGAGTPPTGPAPGLRLRPVDEAVREAFRSFTPSGRCVSRRIEIGHSEEVLAGLQGCYNDRPFAGFAAGHLRIVRAGSGPGPAVHGTRLYVATVDVVLTGGHAGALPGRPLDFATLPPAPVLTPVLTPVHPADEARAPQPATGSRHPTQTPGTRAAR